MPPSAATIETLLRTFSPHLLDRSLALLRTEWETSQQSMPVQLKRVLAEAWNEARMARCREHFAAKHVPPPLKLVGMRIGHHLLYSVTSGNHRAIVAREFGHKSLPAIIGGYYAVRPANFFLGDGYLWQLQPDGTSLQDIDVPEQLEPVLVMLGVRHRG